MACNFSIISKQNIDQTYQIALREIKQFGTKYEGDATGGRFGVDILGMTFKGIVKVEGAVILVEITDKPLLIPCSFIESSLKNYMANLQQ